MSDAASDGAWTQVRKQTSQRDGPRLTVYSNGSGYLNATADLKLGQPSEALLLYDQDTGRIAITCASDDPDAYSITREDDTPGGEIRLASALTALGVDVEGLDDTHFFDVEISEQRAVADVSRLLDTDSARAMTEAAQPDGPDSDGDDDGDNEGDQQLVCGESGCEFTTDSERGLAIHQGQTHDDNGEEGRDDDGEAGDGGTGDDLPSLATVRDIADEVESVQALAEALDLSPDTARGLARDASVYADLRDNPPRPGVDR